MAAGFTLRATLTDYGVRGPQALARFLGFPVDDVFPISYGVRKCVKGHPAALAGSILREPRVRLTRAEIIGMAVPKLSSPANLQSSSDRSPFYISFESESPAVGQLGFGLLYFKTGEANSAVWLLDEWRVPRPVGSRIAHKICTPDLRVMSGTKTSGSLILCHLAGILGF